MNNQDELISIVIPAHNEEKDIRNCLRSIKNQTYKSIEVIVADNASTDRTAAIAREEGATVVYEAMPGVCAARQRGTEKARGTIVVSTDADTVFHKDWIKRIAETFASDLEIVAVGGPFLLDARAPWWGNVIFTNIVFGILRIRYKWNGSVMNLFGSNTAFKRDAFEGYDTSLNQGGDEIVLLRQLRQKGKIVFLFNNTVITSSRRLDKGFWYFLLFYVFDYFYSLATGKSLVPPRAIRSQKKTL